MRRVLLHVLVAATLLGASACSGDPEPRFADPSPSVAEPSGSATPSPQSPRRKPKTRRGVIEAWVEARNAALQDGDTRGMRALGTAGCEGCKNFIRGIEEVFKAGGYYDTEGWVVKRTASVAPNTMDARVRTGSGTIVESSGDQPREFVATTRDLRFLFRRENNWVITNIGLLQR